MSGIPTSLREAALRLTTIQHVLELDGIRGLAISLVLLFHLKVPLFGVGWCGVDLFFVLSGFLITSILLTTKDSPGYFSSFYARRILRIFPLYFSTLFAIFCIALPIAHYFHLAKLIPIKEQVWFWFYLSNWWNSFGHNIYYLSHFWTLAVEEQFYLLWPLVVFVLSRRALTIFCGAVVTACLFLRIAACSGATNPEFVQRATIFRMDALALGGLVALLVGNSRLTERLRALAGYGAIAGFVLVAIIVAKSGPSMVSLPMMTAGYTILAGVSGCVVFRAAVGSGGSTFTERVLRMGCLRQIGKYSYGIYVLHYPIAILILEAKKRVVARFPSLETSGVALILTVVLGFSMSYGAALLTWNFIEKHFLKWKDRFRYETIHEPLWGATTRAGNTPLVTKIEAVSR